MRSVLDSNVLVSAMLSPHGAPAQVVRLALQGEVVLLHDARILAEYREVLSRPRFGFAPEDVQAVMEGLDWSGEDVMAMPLGVLLPDPDDLPFLEVAVAGRANALVTGNARHFRPKCGRHDVDVLTPREFLDRIADKE